MLGPHMKDANNGPLPPPHDICVGHSEPLSFINPRTGLECSKIGNAYYHVSLICIKKKHLDFGPSQVVCCDEVKELLKAVHFQYLWVFLVIISYFFTMVAFSVSPL